MGMKQKRILQFLLLSLVLVTSYNNCSKGFNTSGEDEASSKSSLGLVEGGLCEEALLGLFNRGYYQFVRSNCTSCHASDSDKPQFASPDMSWAYKVFMDKGYTKVSDNAISIGHQPPYTGPQHTQSVNEMRLEWQQGIREFNQCKGTAAISESVDPAQTLSLETQPYELPDLEITLPTADKPLKITWDLNSELRIIKSTGVLPVVPGAKLSIELRRYRTQGGEDYYTVTRPIVFGSTVDVIVKTMYVKINGRTLKFPTTFKFLSASIRAGSVETPGAINYGMISTGALTAPGAISSKDLISLAFEKIEATDLPPPKPPILANIAGDKVVFVDSTTGKLNLEVVLSDTSDDPVTLNVVADGSAVCGAAVDALVVPSATCLPGVLPAMTARGLGSADHLKFALARSVVGNTFNRYDWDYNLPTTSMTLGGSESRRAFSVDFSKNLRREENRILTLRLDIASSTARLGSQDLIYVVIRKADNPAPALGEITFSDLMNPTGILNLNCVKCHNSRDNNGGYDMTNYDLMISRGVLIPGDKMSKMFRRMNATDPGNVNLTPMPVDRFMSVDKIDAVSEWILKGAKNN